MRVFNYKLTSLKKQSSKKRTYFRFGNIKERVVQHLAKSQKRCQQSQRRKQQFKDQKPELRERNCQIWMNYWRLSL